MIKEYGWNTKSLGVVFSAFFWGYFLLQLPVGWLADKFGARKLLGISMASWGIFSILTPMPSNVYGLSAVRAGLGARLSNSPTVRGLASGWCWKNVPESAIGST
jgi:MFS family permease